MHSISQIREISFRIFRFLFGFFAAIFSCFAFADICLASNEYCLPTSHWNENYGIDKQADFIFVGKIQKAIQIGILHGEKPKKVSTDYELHFVAAILSLKISKVLKGQNPKLENINILEVLLCGDCDFRHKIIHSDMEQQGKYDISYFVAARSKKVSGEYGPFISMTDMSFLRKHRLKFDYIAYHCRDAFIATNSKEYFRILSLVGKSS